MRKTSKAYKRAERRTKRNSKEKRFLDYKRGSGTNRRDILH